MKDTYNNNSQAIYTKALETAAEEVAFYQSKLEKSKELFSLCERLLAGLPEDRSNSPKIAAPKKQDSAAKASRAQKIIDAVRGVGWFSITKVVTDTGLSYSEISNWLNYHKDLVEYKLKEGHSIHKYYRLKETADKNEKNVENHEKIIPLKIRKAITGRYLPLKEIAKTAGYSINGMQKWINANSREIEVSLSTKVRPGWKVKTYKLKA